MNAKLDKALARWAAAKLLDAATAERIRTFEAEQEKSSGLRWPVLLAVAFGGVLLGAGVLLFVAAHWDNISPTQRFLLVLLMTVAFHLGGALVRERFRPLAVVLHAVGTACLGAGIALAGQIFNLQEHWPSAILLWAVGAWIAWALLRDWPQAALAAILTPAWLASEWYYATEHYSGEHLIAEQGLLLLAITYVTARTEEKDTTIRRALMWIGGLLLIPEGFMAAEHWWGAHYPVPPVSLLALGWTLAFALPLGLAYWLRGRAAWMNLLAGLWVAVLSTMTTMTSERVGDSLFRYFWRDFGRYLWLWLGCVGLIVWGLKELRKERVNLGVACFGITTMAFYFASIMDKLGRSTSLISLGVLFLAGGWILERSRRRLLARITAGGT